MTRKQGTASLGIAGAALLSLAGYVSATYLLDPAVMDSGGGKASSSNYELDCSIGGPVVATTTAGTATSTNYTLDVNTISLSETHGSPPAGGGDSGGGCLASGSPEMALPLLGMVILLLRRHS